MQNRYINYICLGSPLELNLKMFLIFLFPNLISLLCDVLQSTWFRNLTVFYFFGSVTTCANELRDNFIIQLIIWNLKLLRSTWNLDISCRENPGPILQRLCGDDKGVFHMLEINVCGNYFWVFSKPLKSELKQNKCCCIGFGPYCSFLGNCYALIFYQITQCGVNQIICSLA